MKKKLKLLLAVLFLPFLCTINGCKKDAKDTPADGNAPVEVSFNVDNVSNRYKIDVQCLNLQASYVKVTLEGPGSGLSNFKLEAFYLNSIPYTKGIKLVPGNYTIKEFIVYNDNGTPGNEADDIAIWATPHAGSEFAVFLAPGMSLDKTFIVEAFKKIELQVEVVCYIPENWTAFGFVYFQMEQIIIREKCFFGDLCIKSLDEYNIAGTTEFPNFYKIANNGNPIAMYDLVAIFKIEVWRNNIHQLPDYSNAPVWVNNAWVIPGPPTCVSYGDYVNHIDQFEFKLFVYARVGAGFGWVQFNGGQGMINPWAFNDISNLTAGDDNIVDFVVGNCVQSTSDYVWPPYVNLPLTCTYNINMSWGLGQTNPTDAYVGFSLGGFGAGYDIQPGQNYGYCADMDHVIYINQNYDMNVRSSLYPGSFPCSFSNFQFGRMNWIVNHYFTPTTLWSDIQAAFWHLNNSWSGSPAQTGVAWTPQADNIATAAEAAVPAGGTFTPLPGGWVCVLFFNQANCEGTQVMVMRVDP